MSLLFTSESVNEGQSLLIKFLEFSKLLLELHFGHMGLMLVGLLQGTQASFKAAVTHFVNRTVASAAAFEYPLKCLLSPAVFGCTLRADLSSTFVQISCAIRCDIGSRLCKHTSHF